MRVSYKGIIRIFYMFHSCFCVLSDPLALLFDYPSDEFLGERRSMILEVAKRLLKGRRVLALFSHGHWDHYGRGFIEVVREAGSLTLIVSCDIARSEEAFLREMNAELVVAEPHKTYSLGGIEVKTFESTDVGVAYLVKLNGLSVYHSGDLARWIWPDLPRHSREAIDRLFREEVGRVASEEVDVAIVVAEPRLPGWGGVDYFVKKVSPTYLIPAHLWGKAELTETIRLEMQGLYPSTHFVTYIKEGEEILSLPLRH